MQNVLDFYRRPSVMTSAGGQAVQLDGLPRDVGGLASVVQGLLLHQLWASKYGVTLTDERRAESHIRPVERMLEHVMALDAQPLTVERHADSRLMVVCRHFAVLPVAMLRAQGVPARARCGFGGYFTPGYFEDHWVCEYWNAAEGRWVLVDAQIDALQKEKLRPDFDLQDVPRDRFLIAGDAWVQCRSGAADPVKFGISFIPGENGLWFIASNLLRDAAALNNMELLPWDDWGAMSGPDDPLTDDQLAFFDHLAELTRAPDASFDALRDLYESDDRLRVPATVRNAVLNCEEAIAGDGSSSPVVESRA